MPLKPESFTFGIEEEYGLVDLQTRDLVSDVPADLIEAFETSLGKQFSTEYMRSQIEIGTVVCRSMSEARREIRRLRRTVASLARGYGLAPIAAGTHPFARWGSQRPTDKQRYREIADDLQAVGRRMIINGLHVHVGIEDAERRIQLMNEVRLFLPVLLALSTSSPFWQGENTGLKSYRTAINDATPRKGMPEVFESLAHYEETVGALVAAGVIENATKVWWDIRPSCRFPTLEMRITDVCPRLEDGLTLAALFRCLCRHLSRRPGAAASPSLLVINENRWRAQRYGIDEGLIDAAAGQIAPMPEIVDQLVEMLRDDAEALNCVTEIEHARHIAAKGTSAERQVTRFTQLRRQGATTRQALAGVVDMLIAETAAGTQPSSRPMAGAHPDPG